MPADDNTAWSGLIIEAVRLEVDPYSLGDYRAQMPGCLRANRGTLGLFATRSRGHGGGDWQTVGQVGGSQYEVYFTRWRLVVGEDDNPQILAVYDAGEITFPEFNRAAAESVGS